MENLYKLPLNEVWVFLFKISLRLTGIWMFTGVVLGGCFSIVTFTPFPFLILSTIGIYSAVENCDNIFREAARKSATQQDKWDIFLRFVLYVRAMQHFEIVTKSN